MGSLVGFSLLTSLRSLPSQLSGLESTSAFKVAKGAYLGNNAFKASAFTRAAPFRVQVKTTVFLCCLKSFRMPSTFN